MIVLKIEPFFVATCDPILPDAITSLRQAMAKMGWLLNFDFPMDACHLVAYGTTKADCIRRYHEDGDNFILIDDNNKVRNGWHMGDTIDPTMVNIVDALRGLVE